MSATRSTFVGFGFGPIQAGLFIYEAFRAGKFSRLVVAEVVPETVATLRAAGGAYTVNVATASGIAAHEVRGVEILNPRDPVDRAALVEALAEAQEIATALPSVALFAGEAPDAVARVLADGLRRKRERGGPRAVVYTGENHNHAAELLTEALRAQQAPLDSVACLNTVIGKMSGVVTGFDAMRAQGATPMTPSASRAFLVEAFNRILITRVPWPEFQRGLHMFEEKDDLLPFEEAKLYGHNAIHALLGYRLLRRGAMYLSDAAADPELMQQARAALLEESGAALCRKYAGVDALFTLDGYRAHAEDLLVRMINPYLHDAVERVTRDPRRKLGWNDRLVGTMRLVLRQGIAPRRFAQAARAAAAELRAGDARLLAACLRAAWAEEHPAAEEQELVLKWIEEAVDED